MKDELIETSTYRGCTVGTSDFDAQMSGKKVWKGGGNLRPVYKITINVPVVYMGRYEVVLRGDYP